MEYWFETEIRAHRNDVLASAKRGRLARLAESGRSTGVRAYLADSAQAMSERLAEFASLLRGTENA